MIPFRTIATVGTIIGTVAAIWPYAIGDRPPLANRERVEGAAQMMKVALDNYDHDRQVESVEAQLRAARRMLCAMTDTRNYNKAAARAADNDIEELRTKYLNLTGQPFVFRPCL